MNADVGIGENLERILYEKVNMIDREFERPGVKFRIKRSIDGIKSYIC